MTQLPGLPVLSRPVLYILGAVAVCGALAITYKVIRDDGYVEGYEAGTKEMRVFAAKTAQTEIDKANIAAREWKALWEQSTADLVDAKRLAAEREAEKLKARQAAAQSARRLNDYLETQRHDPTACVNQRVPAAIDDRLRDARSVPTDGR